MFANLNVTVAATILLIAGALPVLIWCSTGARSLFARPRRRVATVSLGFGGIAAALVADTLVLARNISTMSTATVLITAGYITIYAVTLGLARALCPAGIPGLQRQLRSFDWESRSPAIQSRSTGCSATVSLWPGHRPCGFTRWHERGGTLTTRPVDLKVAFDHWNGHKWEWQNDASSDGILTAGTALGPRDAWAVGGTVPTGVDAWFEQGVTLIEHWNGTAWKTVESPSNDPDSFYGVAGTSSSQRLGRW